MNANLYLLKTKFGEGTQGNRKWWLVAGLVVLVALMAYAQVHNALGARLSGAASAAVQAQPASALTVNSVANTSPITQHQRNYMPVEQHAPSAALPSTTLLLPHYAPSARHGAACNELPAGTPGCQGVAMSVPSAAGSAKMCTPVSQAAQHWDKAYISPC